MQNLPERLRIDFRSVKPSYTHEGLEGCSRSDLLAAGVCEAAADELLWNSYANEVMERTLVRPEEWFWTDRNWWKSRSPEALDALYGISGGAFSDLRPRDQADLLGVSYRELRGRKARGNSWVGVNGDHLDIVRCAREQLTLEGYEMGPPFPENVALLVVNHAEEVLQTDISFIHSGSSAEKRQRSAAYKAIEEVVECPAVEWDRKTDYYELLFNSYRKHGDFDRDSMLRVFDVVGAATMASIFKHHWAFVTHMGSMSSPRLPPLIGRKNGEPVFFFVTQKGSFRSDVSLFVRNYALPLKLNVVLLQMLPESGS